MSFFERVKYEIKNQNTTQEWLAKECGLSVSTFKGWISKNRIPNVYQAVDIAQALGVTVEYLISGEDGNLLPERLRYLCNDMKKLAEDDIQEIETLVGLKVSRYEPAKERLA